MATIAADSCSYADVSAAITAASNGDTVTIPAGSATWASRLVITKFLSIIGAGSGSTTITGGIDSSGNTDNTTYWLISFNPTTPALNQNFRLSGLTINGGARIGALGLFNSDYSNVLTKVRIDHVAMTNSRYNYIVFGPVYGVMDNCTISGSFINATHYSLDDSIWSNLNFTLGTANNFYVEDCTFEAGEQLVNAGWGARYAYRYNTVNAHYSMFPCWDAHGNMNSSPGQGNNWSTQGIEIYQNTLNFGGYMAIIVDHRGGRAAVWGNNFYNSVSAGYQIREEYNDANNPPATAPDGQPQYPSGSYYWLNRKNDTTNQVPAIASTLDYDGLEDVPAHNREFWYEVASFNGSSGVGVGPLSSRPSSGLTTGVGWWDTTNNVLYRATGATTWETLYTPYTYPHPLRTESYSAETFGPFYVIVDASEQAALSVDYPKARVVVGNNATYLVRANAHNGFTGDITLDATGLPTNATDSYATNPIAYNGSTTATIATSGVAAGTYSINITGTSAGGDVASIRVVLEVVEAADFDLKIDKRYIRAKQGDNAVFQIRADSLSGFTSDINLDTSLLPEGASATFGDSSLAYNGSTTLTIDTTNIEVGTHEFYITGAE